MDKPSRPVRNRKRSRKAWPPGDTHRPVKRLFTPEIKRMLKDWLVRRRENPYPNREEKNLLAIETGLTYTQICNWFANWRRKLKNSGNDPPARKTWGNLIKNYNTHARGNVEQFSICSSDSIWGELGGVDHSRDSCSPPSSGEHVLSDAHHQHQHHAHQHQAMAGMGGAMAYLRYPLKGTVPYGKAYEAYDNGAAGGQNNNSDSCRNNNILGGSDGNGRKYLEYVRVPEYGRVNERPDESPPNEDARETYPAATFCFDHCYTPRNYEAVFGIPEETRCYKVTQIDGKYVPDGSGTTLEPLILTTAATYGRPYGKEVHSNGTLFLTPTTTLSPATPIAPIPGGRSRSSKYKNSIMEKYLRDLGELEATEPDRTVVPVLMAAIPFQQAHFHHHSHETHEQQQQEQQLLQHEQQPLGCEATVLRGPPSLSKWLESTAKFTPSKHNYIDWNNSGKQSSNKKRCDSGGIYFGGTGPNLPGVGPPLSSRAYSPPPYGESVSVSLAHQKDEIDAAEALTRLANNFRTKFTT